MKAYCRTREATLLPTLCCCAGASSRLTDVNRAPEPSSWWPAHSLNRRPFILERAPGGRRGEGRDALHPTALAFARLELQRAVDAAAEQGRPRSLSPGADASGASVVLAGDFNFDRSAELHAFLKDATLPRAGERAGRAQKNTAVRKLGRAPALLPLQDAYLAQPPPWGPTLRSSYRNGRLLDFVWTSSSVSVLRTMPVCDLAGSSQPHQLPSQDHPSDHLPIGALLSWPGAPEALSTSRPAWQQLYVENVQRQRRR